MKSKSRRHGLVIMSRLILILGSLSLVMLLAILMGSLGFISAMGVTISGSLAVAKALGEDLALSYRMIIGLALACGLTRGLLRYFEQYANHYIAFKLLAVLRDKIFTVLRKLSPAKLETKQKGAIIAMITSDIETLEVFYAHTISPIFIAIVVSTLTLIFIGLVSSYYLSLLALLAYLTIGLGLPLLASGKLRDTGVSYRSDFSGFSAFFMDSIKGLNDLVLNNAGQEREVEVEQRSAQLLDKTKQLKQKTSRYAALTDLCVSLFSLLSLALGLYLVSSGQLSLGRMIIGLVTILSSFGPVIALSALPGNLTQTLASGDRVLDLLAEEPAVQPVVDGQSFNYKDLELRDLGFAYEPQHPVLHQVNFKLGQGQIMGIVGHSGCGKSTLLKLLLRFWQKDQGQILYNGLDIDQISNQSLLDNVTMVSQSTYLFSTTIAENLLIAKPDASQADLEAACKQASIHDFICQLPQGYQTHVGQFGDRLSAGEKQRIGLARAFLSGAKLILLDEPTSNVDSINEGIILKAIQDQKASRSFILVSHRESTMSIADQVYRMDAGRLSRI